MDRIKDLGQYYVYRHLMDNGDLLEFATHSFVGRMIRKITKKDVNHTALLWCVDQFKNIKDRKFIMEALANGLELNLISARLKNYKGTIYWHYLKGTKCTFYAMKQHRKYLTLKALAHSYPLMIIDRSPNSLAISNMSGGLFQSTSPKTGLPVCNGLKCQCLYDAHGLYCEVVLVQGGISQVTGGCGIV